MKEDLLLRSIEVLCKEDGEFEKQISPRLNDVVFLLSLYIKEIELFNNAYGLVAVKNTEELITRHIIDSIAPLGIFSRFFKHTGIKSNADERSLQIADAGSGAGLPGIPLAILFPEYEFTLIERMGRRAGFLWNTKAALGISNITIEESELEKTQSGRFDFITFRAFKPLDKKLLKTLVNASFKDGIIAAYKGRSEKIEEEMSFLQNPKLWKTLPYPVPFLDEERHILLMNCRDVSACL